MYYYDVLIAHNSYRARDSLTYQADKKIPIGSIVDVPIRKQTVRAVVIAQRASAPKQRGKSFVTKPITTDFDVVLPKHMIELIKLLLRYYPASAGEITQLFAPTYSVPKKPKDSLANQSSNSPIASNLPALTTEQQAVLAAVTTNPQGVYFLHGQTGSGKTRVLIEQAKLALERGQSTLVLSPEIGLSSQLAQDFTRVFGDRVIVAHSQLTIKQRREIWHTARNSDQPRIFIGPRSALFLPITNLGFIGVDEAHESAYKQETAPYYNAVPVAALLARVTHSLLMFASATPAVATYFSLSKQAGTILTMQEVAVKTSTKSRIVLIDMRDTKKRTKSEILSDAAIDAMKNSIQMSHQSLVFLNRRGSATVVYCQTCGWRATCPECDSQLTYHGDTYKLVCHVCGNHENLPTSCPTCGSPEILYRGAGTKAVVTEVSRLFPSARIVRFDADNTKSESLYENLERVRAGDVDIVIGTQMIAKGLDLPKLGCVVVVAADSGLAIPDFSSEERTYQQLHQVIGRVQRGHVAGTAVVQAYQPDNPVIQAALHQDWRTFYAGEVENRKRHRLPPYRYVAQVSFARKTAAGAEKFGLKLKEILATQPRLELLGPAPHFHEKERGMFKWHIIVRSASRDALVAATLLLPNDCKIDIDPVSLL